MPSWLRTILLAAVAGTVLGVGLGFLRSTALPGELEVMEVGALEPLEAPRPISEKESGMPAYDKAQLSAFGEEMHVSGKPMATGWYTAPEGIEEVQLFYERRLSEAGMPMISKRFPNGLGYVGYKESTTGLQHTATLVPQGTNSTMVFVSTSSSEDVLRAMADAKVPEILPHPPTATRTTVMGAGLGSVGQQWVSAVVPGQSMAQVLEFYQQAFVEQGWSLSEAKVDPKRMGGWIKARKGPHEAQITLKDDPLDRKAGVQLFALLTDHSGTTERAAPVAN